jgi:hypothetical protein
VSLDFKSQDWLYVKEQIEELLKNQRSFLEQPDRTSKERIFTVGQIYALKKILALPQALPAAKGNN